MIAYNMPVNISGNSSTLTVAYNHGGENGVLVVLVSLIPDNDQEVVSVTYNGVVLTKKIKTQTQQYIRLELWYMINPPIGNYDVIVNLSGTAKMLVDVVSITGVNQVSPLYFNTTVSGVDVATIPFSIQEKLGNGILGIGATNSDACAYIFTESGQTELFKNSYNEEILSQAIYALSTQTGILFISNFLTKPSNWSLILLNIEAV